MSSSVEQVKEKVDIVELVGSYVKLQKAGINYRALCPFHSEKSPSFFVSPSRQTFKCFGCGQGGDIFRFLMEIEGVEFGDALRLLAKRAGVELVPTRQDSQFRTERTRMYELCELACQFFEKQLQSSAGKEALSYLFSRGVSEGSVATWRLGYAPDAWQGLSDFLVGKGYTREEIIKAGLAIARSSGEGSFDRFRGRVMFPIHDLQSQVIGFGGRVLKSSQDEVKYMNVPSTPLYDKSRVLYGLDKAKLAVRKQDACILVEGYMDVILSSQAGIEHVAAVSGTALTPHHLRVLGRYTKNLATAFDMDAGGDSATRRGINLAQSQGFAVNVILMPEGKDPADLVREAPERWKELCGKGVSVMDFYFSTAFSSYDKKSQEGRRQITELLLPVIKRIPNRIERSHWVRELASRLGVGEEDVLEEMAKTESKEERYGIEPEERVNVPSLSRKERIEERLLMLLARKPEYLSKADEEFSSMMSERGRKAVQFLREGKKGTEEIDESLREFYNYYAGILMRAEIEEIQEGSLEEELDSCARELARISLKERLDAISREIKLAESEQDGETVEKLLHDFHTYSSKLFSLDSEKPFSS